MISKGRFLIKGGKGRIGLGERQVAPDDIIVLYQDDSQEKLTINRKLTQTEFVSRFNKSIITYGDIPVIQANNDDFSNPGIYFNPNPYIIIINSKKEFYFGVDKTKPNSRFNPRGTYIKLDKTLYNNPFNPIPVAFYCEAHEEAVFTKGSISFYKLHLTNNRIANVAFTEGFYNFSFYREEQIQQEEKNINLPLRDVPLNNGVTVSEAKAEVKESVLYLTIKGARSTNENVSGFSICTLPIGYRPKRNFNVQFFSNSGETFYGGIETNGNVTVNNNQKTNEQYLQIAIPV